MDFSLKALANALRGSNQRTSGSPMATDWANTLRAALPGYGMDPRSAQAQALRDQVRQQSIDIGMNIGPGAMVYHGSPHLFDAFKMSQVGTGEGAQAYGHGLYFSDSPQVAKWYKENLGGNEVSFNEVPGDPHASAENLAAYILHKHNGNRLMAIDELARRNNSLGDKAASLLESGSAKIPSVSIKELGATYKVDLPDEAISKMLDWDKPLSQQSPEIRKALKKIGIADYADDAWTGAELHDFLTRETAKYPQVGERNAPDTSVLLRQAGIPGIKYLDQGSRSAGKGTYNYVVFDENLPKIIGRE